MSIDPINPEQSLADRWGELPPISHNTGPDDINNPTPHGRRLSAKDICIAAVTALTVIGVGSFVIKNCRSALNSSNSQPTGFEVAQGVTANPGDVFVETADTDAADLLGSGRNSLVFERTITNIFDCKTHERRSVFLLRPEGSRGPSQYGLFNPNEEHISALRDYGQTFQKKTADSGNVGRLSFPITVAGKKSIVANIQSAVGKNNLCDKNGKPLAKPRISDDIITVAADKSGPNSGANIDETVQSDSDIGKFFKESWPALIFLGIGILLVKKLK